MRKYFTREFWDYTGERVIKTAAQTAIATLGTTALMHEVDWLTVLSISGMAAVLSLLTAVANYDGSTPATVKYDDAGGKG